MQRPSKPTQKRPKTRAKKMLWLMPLLVVGTGGALWLSAAEKEARRQQGYPTQTANLPGVYASQWRLMVSSDSKTLYAQAVSGQKVFFQVRDSENLRLTNESEFKPPQSSHNGIPFYLQRDGKTVVFIPTTTPVIAAADARTHRALWGVRQSDWMHGWGCFYDVSGDGRMVAIHRLSPLEGEPLTIVDLTTNKVVRTLPNIPQGTRCLWTADGQELFVVPPPNPQSFDKGQKKPPQSIQIWRVSDGKLLSTFKLPTCYYPLVSLSPNGQQLLVLGGYDCGTTKSNSENSFQVYDLKTHTVLWSYKTAMAFADQTFQSPTWSPDGQKIALAYPAPGGMSDGPAKILVFNAQVNPTLSAQKRLERTLMAQDKVRGLVFSPDNTKLYGVEPFGISQ